jgi:MYXO-CTERM domain-containing protein
MPGRPAPGGARFLRFVGSPIPQTCQATARLLPSGMVAIHRARRRRAGHLATRAVVVWALAGLSPEAAAREVYVNLDPTNLVDDNGQNPVTNSFSSSGFTPGAVSGWQLTEAQRDELLFWLKEATVPFAITYTFSRPAAAGYDMVVFGTREDQEARFPDIAGCSTAIGLGDCLDAELANISFVFYGCLTEDNQTDMRRVAFHLLTALGFGWGLENVSVNGEIMGGYSVFGVEFGNSCQSVVAGSCPHEACPEGQQNSTADLLARIGPRVDDGPPTLSILTPANMDVVNRDFQVVAEADDGFGGLTVSLDIVEAMQTFPDPEPPYEWALENVPPGPWTLRVQVTDADGNERSEEVVACVETCDVDDSAGSAGTTGDPSTTGDDSSDGSGSTGNDSTSGGGLDPTTPFDTGALGPAGSGCHCLVGPVHPSSWGWWLLALGLAPRRRRVTRAE